MTTERVRSWSICAVCLGLLFALCGLPIHADIDGDVRAGAYTDAEAAMVGGGVLVNLEPSNRWYFNPNLEVAFPDDRDLMTVNGDFHYDFPATKVAYWVGGGPAIRFVDPEFGDDDTDLGANVLAGLGARQGDVRPFGQLKVLVADDSEAVLMFGLRF